MPPMISVIGQQFGELVVLEQKGVYKSGKKWMAKIKSIYLGTFETELEAVKMYDKWAKMLYGTFAHINVSKTG